VAVPLCLSITLPYSTITFPYSTILQEYFELLQEYFRILRKKKQEFAATLLPPIFPLNRAFNAIWWQPCVLFFPLQNLEGEEKKINFATESKE